MAQSRRSAGMPRRRCRPRSESLGEASAAPARFAASSETTTGRRSDFAMSAVRATSYGPPEHPEFQPLCRARIAEHDIAEMDADAELDPLGAIPAPLRSKRLETRSGAGRRLQRRDASRSLAPLRSEEHTSELQSQSNLVCRLLLEKKKKALMN